MMQDQLKKVIKLAKKTGDRVIVFNDQEPDLTYVVMGLDEYEKMIVKKSEVRSLTEEELLDKINRDIAFWKNEQECKEEKLPKYPAAAHGFYDQDLYAEIGEDRYEEEFFVQPELSIEESPKQTKRQWAIPEDRKEAAEEIIEEDRQYLEEVTF